MTARVTLSVMAAFWILAGLVGLIVPAQYMSSFGLAAPTEAIIAVRDGGVVLIGLGIMTWLVRGAVGTTLRGVLWGNIFILVADAALNIWEMIVGTAPAGPWIGSFAFSALLVLMLALRFREAGGAIPQRRG